MEFVTNAGAFLTLVIFTEQPHAFPGFEGLTTKNALCPLQQNFQQRQQQHYHQYFRMFSVVIYKANEHF